MPQPNNAQAVDLNNVLDNYDEPTENSGSAQPVDPNSVLEGYDEYEQQYNTGSSPSSFKPGQRVGALSNQREEEGSILEDIIGDPANTAEETWNTLGGIVRDTAQGAINSVDALGDAAIQGAFNTLTLHQAPETSQALSDQLKGSVTLPEVEEPNKWQNQLAREITPFFIGSGAGTKAVDKARKLADDKKLQSLLENAWTRNVGGPAIGTGVVSENEEQTGTEGLYELGSAITPFNMEAPGYLQIDDNDSVGERKLKMVLDDVLLGSTLSGIGKISRAFKGDSVDLASRNANDPKLKYGDSIPEGQVGDTLADQGPIIEKSDGTNINLRKINTEDEVRNLIKEVSETNPEAMARGRNLGQSHETTSKLAANLGLTPEQVQKGIQGSGYTASELYALTNIVLPKSGQDVMNLAKRVSLEDNPGDELVNEFNKAYMRHVNIQEQVIGARAEAGRALNILKSSPNQKVEDYIKAQSEIKSWDSQKAKKVAEQLNQYSEIGATQAQANHFMRDVVKGTPADKFKELWYNSLLSGLSTHMTNVLSNAVYAAEFPVITAAAAGSSAARRSAAKTVKGAQAASKALGKRMLSQEQNRKVGERLANLPGADALSRAVNWADSEQTYGFEGAAELYGMLKAIPEAVGGGVKTFWREEPTDPQTKAEILQRRSIPTIYGGDIANFFRERGGAGTRTVEDQVTGQLRTEATGLELDKWKGFGRLFREGDTLELKLGGKQARTFGNLLVAQDDFFKTIHQRASLYKQAYKRAADEGYTHTPSRSEALTPGSARFKRAEELAKNPTPEMIDEAIEQGRRGTFTDKPGPWLQKAQGLINQTPGGFLIAPFIRTPGKLIHRSVEQIPVVGLAFPNMRRAIKNGGREADEAIGKQLVGTGLFGTFATLGYQGYATGSLSPDPGRRRLQYYNMQPNSLRLPGQDASYSFSRIEPLGIVAGIAADVGNTIRRYQFEEDAGVKQDASLIADLAINSFSENFLSKTWTQGIANWAEGFTNPYKGLQYPINQLAGTSIPTIMAHHQKALDPSLKRAETLSETLMARWEGIGKTVAKGLGTYKGDLNPRVNVAGEPVEFDTPAGPGDNKIEGNPMTDMTYWTRMASPVYKKNYKDSPVWKEFMALGVSPRPPKDELMGVKLTKDQYYVLHAQEKKIAWNLMGQLVDTKMWQELEPYPDVKKELISDVYSASYRTAILDLLAVDDRQGRKSKHWNGGDLMQKLGGMKRVVEDMVGRVDQYRYRRALEAYRNGDVDAMKNFYDQQGK